MARKVVNPLAKFVAPRKGDETDKRCAFVTKYDDVQHKKITFKQWCSGCGFYVCDVCLTALVSRPDLPHDMADHQPVEDDHVN